MLMSNKSLNTMSQKSTHTIGSTMSQKSTALAYNINQLSEKKWNDLELNVDSLKLPASARSTLSNIRYSYLHEGSLKISTIESNKKLKMSPRYAYLFDGLLILLKKQPSLPYNQSGMKMFKFKKVVFLDKFFLNDLDERSFSFSSSSSTQGADREVFTFFCNPSEKTRWMSMLCYSKYKVRKIIVLKRFHFTKCSFLFQ